MYNWIVKVPAAKVETTGTENNELPLRNKLIHAAAEDYLGAEIHYTNSNLEVWKVYKYVNGQTCSGTGKIKMIRTEAK
jgi:hypothetical protein